MVDGGSGEVEPTPLPCRNWQDGPARGAQAAMVVAHHDLDAALDQAVEAGTPVNLGLKGSGGDAEQAATVFGIAADGLRMAASRSMPLSRTFS